jgi:hypothetical protein
MPEYINTTSFAAGEIAPDLYSRVDLDIYYIGLRTCKNFIVRQYGGAANRPGTNFLAEVRNHAKKVRLIPFQFNELQTYALEFGDLYMRVIKDGAEVLESAKTITGITQANPGVITAVGHGFSNNEDVFVKDVVGMTRLNGRAFRTANVTANTFELKDFFGNNVSTTGYAAYISGGTVARVYTLTTPWVEDDLFELNYTQSNDVITILHPDYYPRDITRTANDAWTIANFNNKNGPFKDINITATTVQTNATTGSVTVTASTGIFDNTMVGELFYIEQSPNDATPRWEPGKTISSGAKTRSGENFYQATNSATTGTWRPDHTEGTQQDGTTGVTWQYLHSGFGIVKFTGYTSATVMTATVQKTLPDNIVSTASTNWAKSAWSVAEGYPIAAAYHKQRLWFGGTPNNPNGLWVSTVAARTEFGKNNPILDDDSITLKLDSTQQANSIRHLTPLKQLITLTSGAEHLINGRDSLILATEPPSADVQGYSGSSKVIPIIIGTTAIFVQDMGNQVRSLKFDLTNDAFTGVDLSARSPHLFKKRVITNWAYQREPFSVVWVVQDNGRLLGFTILEEQKVFAWHRHETLGSFESVCCIREGAETAVYFVIKRTINGRTVRYVERLASRQFYDSENALSVEDAHFVDCGLVYDGRNTTSTTITISGGTTWNTPETLTLTASSAIFKSTDVGDEIVFWYTYNNDADKEITQALRLRISAFTSSTVISAIPTKIIPASYRNAARTDWRFARNQFFPLEHLEGQTVACLADGNVVEGLVVTGGKVTLLSPASVVHIGLPYTADLETLDIVGPGGQLKNKPTNISTVFISAQESRSLQVGINGFDSLREIKQRNPGIGYDLPIPAETRVFEAVTNSQWSINGRICLRESNPVPLTITGVTPDVAIGKS